MCTPCHSLLHLYCNLPENRGLPGTQLKCRPCWGLQDYGNPLQLEGTLTALGDLKGHSQLSLSLPFLGKALQGSVMNCCHVRKGKPHLSLRTRVCSLKLIVPPYTSLFPRNTGRMSFAGLTRVGCDIFTLHTGKTGT